MAYGRAWICTLFAAVQAMACMPDTQGVRLIGHGGLGASGAYPMNSAASLFGALEQGSSGIELDVQLTRDSVLVAHHGLELVSGGCTGRVHDHTWSELSQCADSMGGEAMFHGVRVDRLLAECIARYPQAEFTLDLKLNTGGDWWLYLHAICARIAELHRIPGLNGRLLVECQTADLLKVMALEAPEVSTFLYVQEAAHAITEAQALGCRGITIQVGRLTAEQAQRIKAAGLELTVFGVDGPWSMRRALALRPDRIQVDG